MTTERTTPTTRSTTRTARAVHSRTLTVGALIALLAGVGLTTGASASAGTVAEAPISAQGFHTSRMLIENNTVGSRLVQSTATSSTDFEGDGLPASGTTIQPGRLAHYEVVTDRMAGNDAELAYDVVDRFGRTIGTVTARLAVPAWGWYSERYTCEATGQATCTVMGSSGPRWFMITDGSCPGCDVEPGFED